MREHVRIFRRALDQFDHRIETFVGMMQQNVLLPHHLKNIRMRRKGRIARRLKNAVFQLGKGVVRDQRREMSHGKRTVEFVKIGFR